MNKEQYLLLLLMEEAAEVSQAASKCIRFTSAHNHQDMSNIDKLSSEIVDFITVLEMLLENDILSHTWMLTISSRISSKKTRIKAFMEVSKELGALNDTSSDI